MWGRNWGQFEWGGTPVPAAGFWAVLLLGAILGALGIWLLGKARPRTIGLAVLLLAVAIPLSAGAVPFSFTNGTVADATQVNANFAALTPVVGYTQASQAGALSGTVNLMAPGFTPTRAMTCIVTVETALTSAVGSPPAVTASAFAFQNGTGTFSAPTGATVIAELFVPAPEGFLNTQTRVFSVTAGAPLQFGVSIFASASASASGLTVSTLYRCE
jgi:hypothetical protein